jgi:pilus assembly protein CpaB
MYLQSLKTPGATIIKTTILVATDNIPARTLIDKQMVKEIEVSDSSIINDYIRNSSEVIGKYTKETILKNEGFVKEKLLSESSDELALKIDKDHRAITINVTGDGGVADLIKPADFVDIIVYLSEKKNGQIVERPDTAKIMLQNIEILAIDTQINRTDTSTNTSANTANNASNSKAPTTFLVTLSVLTHDLEKLVLAENLGSLKLALRPLKTDGTTDTSGTVWQDLLVDTSNVNAATSNVENSSKDTTYTVKKGDTLKSISIALYGDFSRYTVIKEANDIQNENLILPGEVLKIPAK